MTVIPRGVYGADKAALFENAAMFVLPSFNENFGNTVLEAMVHSLPVVVSEGTGAAQVVRAAGCGIICAPDSSALVAAMTTLLADGDQAAAMGRRGRAAVLPDYGWTAIGARVVALYADLLGASNVVASVCKPSSSTSSDSDVSASNR